MSKKSCFRGPFNKHGSKRAQTLFKFGSKHLYRIHWSLARKLCSKKSLLLTCQISGPLVNTLVADEKYPVLNRDDLIVAIQIELSQNQKTFFEFFAALLKFSLNLKYFEKKDDSHRFCIFEVTDS